MELCAFVFLEDISEKLPSYEETYLSVPMDAPMREAYAELEDAIRKALEDHRGNRSVLSIMLNPLLVYPDHPYGLGTLHGTVAGLSPAIVSKSYAFLKDPIVRNIEAEDPRWNQRHSQT